jgi:hypothetical protein
MLPRRPPPEDPEVPLAARVGEVEVRVTLLEAKVRDVSARVPEQKAAPARTRPRPRCPGCLLELPPGRRGESCVWCGFVFDAVKRRAAK